MAKTATIVANLHWEPANSGPGASGDFDLGAGPFSLAQVSQDALSLAVAEGSPLEIVFPLPAAVLAVRVLSGGPVRVLLTAALGGADQVVAVSDRFLLRSPGAPLTSVKLWGTAAVELLVGG